MKLHTDREILQCIVELYGERYSADDDPNIPIDVRAVAARLGGTEELVFGRLYHDMRNRYHYMDGGVHTTIFQLNVGDKKHCVNFPYLVSVLAEMNAEHYRSRRTQLAVLAIAIACAFSGAAWWSAARDPAHPTSTQP